jgi:hypothetical protein
VTKSQPKRASGLPGSDGLQPVTDVD